MTAPPLSNRLADLAERAGDAWRRGHARTVEAAAAYLESGALLVEAKGECGHGGWLPFLERAGIPARTATRMMRLAESGMSAETIAARRVRAAAEALARTPKPATVADLPAPPLTPTARARKRRAARRVAGRCVDCGAPAPAKARCPDCHARVAEADRRRRALARTLTPRLAEAAKTGSGLTLTAGEVAELAGPDPES